MSEDKLLSIILVGRNDNYGGNFKKRLQLSINYFARNADIIDYLNNCEIIFVDWASQIPISEELVLTQKASQICRFLNINKKQVNNLDFNTTVGVNVGLRRAFGKFHVLMPADILITRWSLKYLLDILSGAVIVPFDVTEYILLIKRYLIPYQYSENDKSYSEIDFYLTSATQYLPYSPILPGLGMDTGMTCHHRKITNNIGGYDESMGGWGKSDTNFCLRAADKYPLINLSGFGIHCYDFMPSSIAIDYKLKKINQSKNILIKNNDNNWGLKQEKISEQICNTLKEPPKLEKMQVTKNIFFDIFSHNITNITFNTLSFNNIIVETSYFFISWHIRNFNSKSFIEFLPSELTFESKKLPKCAVDPCGAVTVVSSLNPTATIYSVFTESKKIPNYHDHKILEKQYLNKHGGQLNFLVTLFYELFPPITHAHKWMRGFAHNFHKGIVRLITGKEDDIISRLYKQIVSNEKIDICLIHKNSVKEIFCIAKNLWPLLNENGIIICQVDNISKTQVFRNKIISEIENCRATTVSDTIVLMKGVSEDVWNVLITKEKTLSRKFIRRFRIIAYLKCLAFDVLRIINIEINKKREILKSYINIVR